MKEEPLEKVRFIAKVKNSLPFDQRGNLNTYGVYVQSGRNREPTLPKEGILYMVGGLTIPKLIFLDEDSGETMVVKCEKGDWLKSLDLSYEKAKKVWVAMQTNDRASVMQALSIEEPDRPRYVDLDMQAYEPSKYEVLNEILLREGTNIIGKSIKHPELLGQSTPSVSINPFNPSDYEYLLSAFLGGPSHMGHFDAERLETILKKLLQDDYDKHYEAAKQRIIASH